MSDFGFSIKVQDNTGKAAEELEKATQRALYAMGVTGVGGAVDSISGEYLAVDTGRLRASISFITPTEKGASGENSGASEAGDQLSGSADKNSVIIGSNVSYAEYVHDGTSRMEARPFLRAGIDNTKDTMKEQVEKIFKGEL